MGRPAEVQAAPTRTAACGRPRRGLQMQSNIVPLTGDGDSVRDEVLCACWALLAQTPTPILISYLPVLAKHARPLAEPPSPPGPTPPPPRPPLRLHRPTAR